MKKPRVNDFDPTAIPQLGSPMDDLPVIESNKEVATKPAASSVIYSHPVQQPEETNEVTFVPSNERSNERRKVRHTFDILADQLLALREIVLEREKTFGRRVLLGELVQEALDMFITKERNTDVTNVRTNAYGESRKSR
jgi:hypothetical protein